MKKDHLITTEQEAIDYEVAMQAAMARAHARAGDPVISTHTLPDGTVVQVVPFIPVTDEDLGL